ncbi:MAG: hypothetical protein ABIA02_03615 [Candidatus Falkowbacteria bacterium]
MKKLLERKFIKPEGAEIQLEKLGNCGAVLVKENDLWSFYAFETAGQDGRYENNIKLAKEGAKYYYSEQDIAMFIF